MKSIGMTVVLLAISIGSRADFLESEIKLRNVDIDGLNVKGTDITIEADFDVKRENLLDEVHFDFYLLLQPRKEGQGAVLLHSRTTHRFLEEKTGYVTGVTLGNVIKECIGHRSGEYAVVATYRGKEVGFETSLKEPARWWENAALGKPIEGVLDRTTTLPIVRTWEKE